MVQRLLPKPKLGPPPRAPGQTVPTLLCTSPGDCLLRAPTLLRCLQSPRSLSFRPQRFCQAPENVCSAPAWKRGSHHLGRALADLSLGPQACVLGEALRPRGPWSRRENRIPIPAHPPDLSQDTGYDRDRQAEGNNVCSVINNKLAVV